MAIRKKRKKSLKLLAHERALLIQHYLRWRIPVDQFEARRDDLVAFAAEWNEASNRTDAPEDVLHYMRTQRKRHLWVKFDGNHEDAPTPIDLTADETIQLVAVFNENAATIECGSDVLACEPEIADLIAKEFAAVTGRIFPAHLLVAKLTALRKRGLLPKVETRPAVEKPADGWQDMDQAQAQ
jgi:hypothetical protein